MSKDTETIKRDAEVAQFRFALIAPVIQRLYPDASATAYYKRVTGSPLTLPDGSIVSYSYKTLEKWKSQHNIGGLDALMPYVRSDKGVPRALNKEAIAKIYRIKKEHPRMNATQIYEHLIPCHLYHGRWQNQKGLLHHDHSRLLVGGELFYNDNAYNFQKVLKDSIATYGIPNKLYVLITAAATQMNSFP